MSTSRPAGRVRTGAGVHRRDTGRHGTLAALAAASFVVVVAGVAWPWWSGGGAGHGAGATRSATSALTLTPGTPSSRLLPGGQAVVATTVSNPAPVDVRVLSLALDTGLGTSGFSVDDAHPGCLTTSLSFATQTNGGAGWAVPANGTVQLQVPGLAMALDAAAACQGASFTVYLKAGP